MMIPGVVAQLGLGLDPKAPDQLILGIELTESGMYGSVIIGVTISRTYLRDVLPEITTALEAFDAEYPPTQQEHDPPDTGKAAHDPEGGHPHPQR